MGDREVLDSPPREQDVGRLIEQLSALGVRLSAEGDELSVRMATTTISFQETASGGALMAAHTSSIVGTAIPCDM